jgi:hypothetical protein
MARAADNKDKKLSSEELRSFYAGSGEAMRHFITRHVSEWFPEPSWADSLKVVKEFRDKRDQIDAMVEGQITPSLWWTDAVSQHARIPFDGIVFHYHPVSFVAYVNLLLAEADAKADKSKIDVKDTKAIPPGITDDRDGIGMASKDQAQEDPCNGKLGLKDMVQGFDAQECQ